MAYQPTLKKLASSGFTTKPSGFLTKNLNDKLGRLVVIGVNPDGATLLDELWSYDIVGESTGAVTGRRIAQRSVFTGFLPNEDFFDKLLKAVKWV
jgi:hypothetical protein